MKNLSLNKKRWWLIVGISALLIFLAYKFFTEWRWSIPSNSEVIISLSRTGCFGSCSSYQVTIYDNGTVVYEGYSYVGARGTRKANIGVEAVQQLAAELESAGYFLLQDKYTEQMWSDSPSIYTYAKIGDREKHIEHYGGDLNAPEELYKLEQLINDTANSRRWTRACSFRYPSFCSYNLAFWIMAAMPLVVAVSITWSFIRRGRAMAGIVRGAGIITVIWILLIFLTNRRDLFGMWSTVGFYSIIGFSELAAVLLLGSFLARRHQEKGILENTG